MSTQGSFEQERELQGRIEQVVAGSMPDVDVLEVELDGGNGVVRVYVDRPGGVDIDLCTSVTQLVREAELCDDRGLEVSSPGIERPLRRPEHFAAVVGEQIRLRRRGAKRATQHTVVGVEGDSLQLEKHDGVRESVKFTDIARAHLDASEALEAALKASKQQGGKRRSDARRQPTGRKP